MSLSRQNVPNLEGSSAESALKGAYVLSDTDGTPDVVIVGTGSETQLAVQAKKELSDLKVRVVSMPCWELFDEQPAEYRQSVFPAGAPVLSVEAASTQGWSKYAHASVGIDRFGESAPINALATEFGMTGKNVAEKATKLVEFYKGKPVPHLVDRPF